MNEEKVNDIVPSGTTNEVDANDILIDIRNVSMRYRILMEKVDNIKEFFIKLVKRKLKYRDLWALKNVTLQVKRGESLGVIGRNGAGKSTLLKLIAGVLDPTEGEITTHGNLVPLLKLGAGFDMNASGKENIYLNGALMGFSHKEMDSKMNNILEFADLGEFINAPLKNYSSGMVSILGFSIAVDCDPDILLVDEILSVGDAPFRAKCADKVMQLQQKGCTFIIVSHDMNSITKMCRKTVWINDNRIAAYGDTAEVVEQYKRYCAEHPERDNTAAKWTK